MWIKSECYFKVILQGYVYLHILVEFYLDFQRKGCWIGNQSEARHSQPNRGIVEIPKLRLPTFFPLRTGKASAQTKKKVHKCVLQNPKVLIMFNFTCQLKTVGPKMLDWRLSCPATIMQSREYVLAFRKRSILIAVCFNQSHFTE